MLNRQNRLPAKEFSTVYTSGKKIKGEYGMLVSLKSTFPLPRFGFVVSGKVGNAVQRHRITRVLRETARELIKENKIEGIDFQYVSFTYPKDMKELRDEFSQMVKKSLKK